MALTRPTLPELVARIQADLVSRLELTGPVRRRSVVYVLARVLAGAVHMLYGAIEYLSRQLFADISEAAYLERDASVYGMSRNPPTYATALVTVTGSAGSSVATGAVLQSPAGYEWAVDTGGTIPGGGSMSLAVTAVLYGADSSTSAGASLTFESPAAGVSATAMVSSSVDGTDREDVEDFRNRFLERKAYRGGNGGSVADYVEWAKTTPGVTRVWVTPQGIGPGTVLVRFARDDDPGDNIPDAGELATVQAYIDTVKPASCALVQVAAPIPALLTMTLSITPDTPALRTAVEAELDAMYLRRANPNGGGTFSLSWLQTAVGDASGVDTFSITLVGGSPPADFAYPDGWLLGRGTLTWI